MRRPRRARSARDAVVSEARVREYLDMHRALRDWRLDPVGHVLEDALEEHGWRRLSHDLRKVNARLAMLHERQLRGFRPGDEGVRMENSDRIRLAAKDQDRILNEVSQALEAMRHEVRWFSDKTGRLGGSRGRAVLSYPVEVVGRHAGGWSSGSGAARGMIFVKPTLYVRVLAPYTAVNRSGGGAVVVDEEDVSRKPEYRVAPNTAGWVRG